MKDNIVYPAFDRKKNLRESTDFLAQDNLDIAVGEIEAACGVYQGRAVLPFWFKWKPRWVSSFVSRRFNHLLKIGADANDGYGFTPLISEEAKHIYFGKFHKIFEEAYDKVPESEYTEKGTVIYGTIQKYMDLDAANEALLECVLGSVREHLQDMLFDPDEVYE